MTIDELRKLQIRQADPLIYAEAKERWDAIAKPVDGLGELEKIICRIASARGTVCPEIAKKALVILCADNGIVAEGVSQCGQDVTFDVAALLGKGNSAVCAMAEGYGLDVLTVDVGMHADAVPEGVLDRKIANGTEDFLREPAMTEAACLRGIQVGMDLAAHLAEQGYDLIATGEMGIGNTTTSTALLCALTGVDPAGVVGRGAGLTDEGLERKRQVIREGLRRHFRREDERDLREDGRDLREDGRDLPEDERALEALRRVGGLDLAGLAGMFIGGSLHGIPVVIAGLISGAAALAAEQLKKGCRDFMIASHLGREAGMEVILERLGLKAVLHADLALGEGSGAVLLLPMLDMAMSLYRNGTRFDETGIARYERYPS